MGASQSRPKELSTRAQTCPNPRGSATALPKPFPGTLLEARSRKPEPTTRTCICTENRPRGKLRLQGLRALTAETRLPCFRGGGKLGESVKQHLTALGNHTERWCLNTDGQATAILSFLVPLTSSSRVRVTLGPRTWTGACMRIGGMNSSVPTKKVQKQRGIQRRHGPRHPDWGAETPARPQRHQGFMEKGLPPPLRQGGRRATVFLRIL